MNNPHTGEVSIDMGGETYTIVYDWNALAKLKTTFTEADLQAVVNGQNLEVMADVLAIGLQKHHEGITAEEVAKLSPPLVKTVEAIDNALTFAYFGPQGAPQDLIKNAAAAQKKTRKKKKK